MASVPSKIRNLAISRHLRSLDRSEKAMNARRREHEDLVQKAKARKKAHEKELATWERTFEGFRYANILRKWLPPNIAYLTSCKDSDFYIDFDNVKIRKSKTNGVHLVPEIFSLIDCPVESYEFIRSVIAALLCEKFDRLVIDYRHCKELSIGAQVFLDIILKDVFEFYKKCVGIPLVEKRVGITKKYVGCGDPAHTPEFVRKILFSVGSFAIHTNRKIEFPDIIPYPLCIHNREGTFNRVRAIERKDTDTTALADYVIESLRKMGKSLTIASREDLCIVIGEVLINAEEHATTQHRFSIGYFQDSNENGKHVGMFRLVIMNFGKTIYEKFSDPNCPNKAIVEKMKMLSAQYTKKKYFSRLEFEEETLWTLYALQEGITSVPDQKRGHGSIQFIDSFFKLNGRDGKTDERSRMTILSGRASITFDNRHRILEKEIGGEKIKVMTFNESGSFEDKPDRQNVRYVENYFPGTVISAKIFFDEEDFSENENERQ